MHSKPSRDEDVVPFLDLAGINARFEPAFHDALDRLMGNSQWILGSEVEAFEAEFARYCGCGHAVGVSNGLDALQLALRALGIGPGDEVIVPAHTFIATWLAVTHAGATIVPVDVNETSWNICPDRVEEAITEKTRAIVAVHLYGRPAPMGELQRISRRHRLSLIEDAAQAHGAVLDGRRAGHWGDISAFSFYPTKNLGALGDGGCVTTDDMHLAERIRALRNYGSSRKYVNDALGYNCRLDEIQAAMLRLKLGGLDADNARRRRIAQRYVEGLADTPGLRLPAPSTAGSLDAWHLFVVRHPRRDDLQRALDGLGIRTQVHYPIAPFKQAAYQDTAWPTERWPVSTALPGEVLSLPMSPVMTDEQVARTVDAVRRAAMSLG